MKKQEKEKLVSYYLRIVGGYGYTNYIKKELDKRGYYNLSTSFGRIVNKYDNSDKPFYELFKYDNETWNVLSELKAMHIETVVYGRA